MSMNKLNLGWPQVLRVPIRVLAVLLQSIADEKRYSGRKLMGELGKKGVTVFDVGNFM